MAMTRATRWFAAPALAFASAASWSATCPQLSQLSGDVIAITAAEQRQNATIEQRSAPELSLPSHCRVAATLTPRPDSEIRMELWMPDQWNGKFLVVGNGGWAGAISYSAMARGLASGYAVASTDTGHEGGSAAFAVGHREKVVDFAWRAIREITDVSKQIVAIYYERPHELAYFEGCSTGGRQGLKAAQMYPGDFDGIIVGAPVNNMLTLNATQLDTMVRFIENPELAPSAEKVALLHDAVMAACEVNDGIEDGFLNDPLACDFEPEVLQCRSRRDTAACLTRDELSSVERAYGGVYSRSGTPLYPGHAKGFELGWRIPAEGAEPSALQTDATRYLVHEDPDWDWREFDLERDRAQALENAGFIEAVQTDLGAFKARGGKLLIYHGWNDPGPSPLSTIDYYNGVLETMGEGQDDWMRLFMMPGVGHCGGGVGPDQADFLGALDDWVEDGRAPERIVASRTRNGETDMTRPLCAFPAVAVWDGVGDPNDEQAFSCE